MAIYCVACFSVANLPEMFFSSITVPQNVNSCKFNVNVCEYIDRYRLNVFD